MIRERFYPGGINPAAPSKNRAELWDDAAGTYTAWDASGTQIAQRALTAQEISDLAGTFASGLAATNTAIVQARAAAALAGNATFLALASPTNGQTIAQVQLLTKECSALIRLTLAQMATITDTV